MIYDVAIIGGGIAAAGAAAAMPPHLQVVLFEREPRLASHATGRSAALYYPSYGHLASVPLAFASSAYFESIGALGRRGVLTIGRADQAAQVTEAAARSLDPDVGVVDSSKALLELCPVLSPSIVLGAHEPNVADLDVMLVHDSLMGQARDNGVEVVRSTALLAAAWSADRWKATTTTGEFEARFVINAAGAWGDEVAIRCGVEPVGLVPMRRTAFTTPGTEASGGWPAVVDADNRFYFKPEGPQLLCSPAEEIPDRPGDPRPRDIDVALAIDRINGATSLAIRTVASAWTGLRTFAPDRGMVIGPEPDRPEFVWLVGQGGTGIQTAPAAGRLVACMVGGGKLDGDLSSAGVEPDRYRPDRLRS